MENLKTDYLDDILASSMGGKRKFRITRSDGSTEEVFIEDATEYEQVGDEFGAGVFNKTNEAVNECFQSVSDGKALIASAITDKKVPTDAKATFLEMAENILKIILGSGNATAAEVLAGKTFTNDDGVEYTGTMANQGAVSGALNCGESYTIPAGYHNGSGKVTANSLASQTSGTATAALITKGYTAWVNGVKLTGTRAVAADSLTGTYRFNFSYAAGTKATQISFSTAFDSIPKVTLQLSAVNHRVDDFVASASSITAQGFTLTVVCDTHDGDNYIDVLWTATA